MAVVLFVFAHPDDETLAACVALAEHAAAGHDVRVLTMTRGTASGVRDDLAGTTVGHWWGVAHNPALEGYAAPTVDEFGQLRIDETRRALDVLASGLGAPIALHEGGLLDTQVTQADAQAQILAVCDQINPGGVVWLKGHTHLVDDNSDHTNIGKALKALAAADPARFSNLRHYVLPRYWADPRLSQVAEQWDLPTNSVITCHAINGMRCYGAWAPPESLAIGYHSVWSDMFAPQFAGPTPKNMYHP
jgi:LmbE family N-acetylglucosaminyl deacetylase